MMSDHRDEFARAALYGMLAHPVRYKPRHSESALHWHDAIASEAYDIADAMVSASQEQVLEQSEKLDGAIVQTVRRDGVEYQRVLGLTMLELLIQAGYDASVPHPASFKDFSYLKLAEILNIRTV
jgi:hypothetical protein